nr:MAG TPA: hypothetical protein [Caudoviricetes sp.]
MSKCCMLSKSYPLTLLFIIYINNKNNPRQ